MLRTYLELVKSLIIADTDNIKELIIEKSVQEMMNILLNNPYNNILHNLVKDILMESLNKAYGHTAPLLLTKENQTFLQIVKSLAARNSHKNSQYENQIFHIFQTLLKKGE